MPRPQFSLKTMLWLTAVVAAFFGGAAWEQNRENAKWIVRDPKFGQPIDMRMFFYPEDVRPIRKRN